MTPFEVLIEQAQAATTLEMGPKFMAEQKKRLVPKFLPDLAPDKQAEIEAECEETAVAVAEHTEEKRQMEIASMVPPDGQVAA